MEKLENATTGANLQKIRTALGLPPREFAQLIKVSKRTVERWESTPNERVDLSGAIGHKIGDIVQISSDPEAISALKETIQKSGQIGTIVASAMIPSLALMASTKGAVSGLLIPVLEQYAKAKKADDSL